MPKTPRLYRNRFGVYYLRHVLPKLEQAQLRKREIWRSLKTKDADLARCYALSYALDLLKDTEGLGIVRLNQTDVIRHPLVKKIIDAFEKAEKIEKQKREDENPSNKEYK